MPQSEPFIDFQGRGELIAAHKIRQATQPENKAKFVILVNTHSDPHPWCVSTYTDSSCGWDSGRYFGEKVDAIQTFNEYCYRPFVGEDNA
jgi:hypothetical protein